MNSVLCIDCGLTGGKALLYDCKGNCIAYETFVTPLERTTVNTFELYNCLCRAVKNLVNNNPIESKYIKCITVSGHGNGLYALTEDKVLPTGYSSMFNQTLKILPDTEEVYSITGQSIWGGQPLSILSWLKHSNPNLYHKIKHILFCKDLLRWFMTGSIVTEITDCSAAGLLNYKTCIYDRKLLHLYDLDDAYNILPKIINSNQVGGRITDNFSKRTGLLSGIPVLGGLFDVNSCLLGSGVINTNSCGVISGTWGINAYITDNFNSNKIITQCCRFFDGNNSKEAYVCIDSAPTSCVNIEKILTVMPTKLSYSEADEIVAHERPNQELIYMPYIYPPMDFPYAKCGFFGLTSINYNSMLRAVFEGIVLEHRYRLEKLKSLGMDIPSIVLSGGAANSPILSQMFADCLNKEVIIKNKKQTGTFGGAILALSAINCYPNIYSAVNSLVLDSKKFIPIKSNNSYFNKKYQLFRTYQCNNKTPLNIFENI